MDRIITLEDALKRIAKLEEENSRLCEELEFYNDFVAGYESGMTMVEIARRNNVSERTIYRYKECYDNLKQRDDKQD